MVPHASFTGLAKVLEVPLILAEPRCTLVALIKPQFEVRRDEVAKGGIVRDAALHERVCGEVSDWLDRHGTIANADVVRITGVDTLRASKLLVAWREQGLLAALPGRAKRNMAYAKPQAPEIADPGALFSGVVDNNGSNREKSN